MRTCSHKMTEVGESGLSTVCHCTRCGALRVFSKRDMADVGRTVWMVGGTATRATSWKDGSVVRAAITAAIVDEARATIAACC